MNDESNSGLTGGNDSAPRARGQRGVVVRDVDAFRRVLMAPQTKRRPVPTSAPEIVEAPVRVALTPESTVHSEDGVVDERELEDWFQRMIPSEQDRIRRRWAYERREGARERAYQAGRVRRDMVDGAIVMLVYVAMTRVLLLDLPGLVICAIPAALTGAVAGIVIYLTNGGRFVASASGGLLFLFALLVVGRLDLLSATFGFFGALAMWSAHGLQRESAKSLWGRPIDKDDPLREWLKVWGGPQGPSAQMPSAQMPGARMAQAEDGRRGRPGTTRRQGAHGLDQGPPRGL